MAALALAAALPAAAAEPPGPRQAPRIAVEQAWIRAQPDTGEMTAGYLTMVNSGDAPAVVVGVECRGIGMTRLHESVERQGMIRMVARDSLVVPPRGRLELRPRGLHLMLMRLARPLAGGERVGCRLRLRGGVTVPYEAEVRAP